MTPILLLIVVNFSVIWISNAQFDCSSESISDDQRKIFCNFNDSTASNKQQIQSKQSHPNPSQIGCGLRNIGGPGMESIIFPDSVSVCLHSSYLV